MHTPAQRVAARHVTSTTRVACIIAAGMFGESYCLLKNRDRNYTPNVKLVHEVRDGVEVAYMKDDKTGWIEGMNEHGVGIVNAALMVSRDESERDEVERTGKKLLDGDRILNALTERTVDAASKSIRKHKEGLKGHTIISDGKKSLYVEMPDSNDVDYDDVLVDKVFVRTNHGVEFPDAGYVKGPQENSSKGRMSNAEKVLSKVKPPDDVAPALLQDREDRWESTEMVRDNKSDRKMRTTTQMVLNLTEKKLTLYLLPGRVKYLGLDDRLPKGFEPKIEVEVLEYTDLSVGTEGETKPVTKKKASGDGLLPILDPAFNIREIFKQLVLLEDHLFQPRKRCPDCIWKHLLTAEGFAEEAITLDVNLEYGEILTGLADSIRVLQRGVQEGLPPEAIAQRTREIRKTLLPVASRMRVASDACSITSTSFAWIDPSGTVHKLTGSKGHEDWSEDYLENHPSDLKKVLSLTNPPCQGARCRHGLLQLGWIRVTNAFTMEAWTVNSPSPKAWDAAVNITIECLLKGGKSPDESIMMLDFLNRSHTMTPGEFVEKYGSKQAAHEMWEALLARTASNPTAAEMSFQTSAGFPVFSVGDFITYGKFQNKPGQIVKMFTDERGIPMIEIAAVGHARRKNRTMGLYRIRHADPAKRVASRWMAL